MPNELRAVNDYLKATQLVVERQVMLEAKLSKFHCLIRINPALTGVSLLVRQTRLL